MWLPLQIWCCITSEIKSDRVTCFPDFSYFLYTIETPAMYTTDRLPLFFSEWPLFPIPIAKFCELPSCSFLTGMGWKFWMWCFCCPLGVTFFLHAFLRRPQLSNLIFSRYQVMYNVFCIVADVEVTWKGFPNYFLLQ